MPESLADPVGSVAGCVSGPRLCLVLLFVSVRACLCSPFEEVDRKRQILMLSVSTQIDAPRWYLRQLLCLEGSPKVDDACFGFLS